MSGPKSSDWSVTENLRLVLAQRQAALAEIARLEAERQAALAEIGQISGQLSSTIGALKRERADVAARLEAAAGYRLHRPAADATIDEIRDFAGRLRSVVAEVRDSLTRAAAFHRIEEAFSVTNEAARREQVVARQRQEAQAEVERNKRVETVARIIARAPSTLDVAERAALEKIASAIIEGTAACSRAIEGELRAEIQRLQTRETRRRKDVAEAATLRSQLWGFESSEAAALSSQLSRVEAGEQPLVAELRSSVTVAIERLKREADTLYAAQVLREEFGALGYDVGENFVTAFQSGLGVEMRHPDQQAYAVELVFEPEQGRFNSELLAVATRDDLSAVELQRRDKAAEERWCRDLAIAAAAAEERQVRTRVRRRVAAGINPVRMATGVSRSAQSKRRGRVLERHLRPPGN